MKITRVTCGPESASYIGYSMISADAEIAESRTCPAGREKENKKPVVLTE